MNVDERLAALKAAEQHVIPPATLEATVLAAFEDRRPAMAGQTSAAWNTGPRWWAVAALAAGVVLGIGGSVIYVRGTQPPVVPAEAVGESVVFVVDPPAVEETVRIVRIRVARSALESLGIQTVAAQEGDSVEVDVLVGEDGVARGVRLAM